MKNKVKLILASAVFVAALMLLVPLAQTDMSGGGGIGNSDSDPIVLSENTSNDTPTSVRSLDELQGAINKDCTNIQLTDDILITGLTGPLTLPSGTLDLNGHTITIEQIGKSTGEINNSGKYESKGNLSVNANRIVTADGATVVIKDGAINYTENSIETGTEKTKSPLRVGIGSNKSELILENVSISSTEYGIGVFKQGTLEVRNSDNNTIHGDVSAVTTNGSANSSPLTSDGAKIKLSGGKYTSASAATIYFPGGETLDVVGGTFEGPTGFDIRAGTVNIGYATVKATGNTETTSKFSAANGPSGWGMGIAVFDHSSYSLNSNISVSIDHVTFDGCTEYNLYVGIHPGNTSNESDVSFSEMNNINANKEISITLNNTAFIEKGAVLKNVKGVTITNCEFNNISSVSMVTSQKQVYTDAILISKCTGNITITGCTIDGVKYTGTKIENHKYFGKGIDIMNSDCETIVIGGEGASKNTIKNVDFNAIQIATSVKPASVTISNNEISNWDSDDDGSDMGRAIRLHLNLEKSPNVSVSNNTFTKTYIIGTEYDNLNILKITQEIKDTPVISGEAISDNIAILNYVVNESNTSSTPFMSGLKLIASENYMPKEYLVNSKLELNIVVGDNDNKIYFKTKGLYIEGVNDVTVHNCSFDNITDTLNNSHYAAIAVINYSGNIAITNNLINGVKVISGGDQNAAGIKLQQKSNLSVESESVTITGNTIKNVDWNAINFANNTCNAQTVTISNNIFEEWDANNDGCDQEVSNFGGRALRLSFASNANSAVVISENTFIKKYNENAKFIGKIEDDNSGNAYDDGNVLKITGSNADFKDNVLRLTGITDYSVNALFKFGDDKTRFLVTFNANGGYFLNDSSNTGLYSLFVVSDGSATVTEPKKDIINRSGSYSFDGWYDAATGGNKLDFVITISDDKTLYAKWTYTGGSGIPVTPPTDDPEPEPIIPDENNNVTVPPIDEKKADELVHEAVSSGSDSVSIIDTSNVEGEYTEVTVSKSDLETISKKIENNNNINSVSIETSEGDIILEKEVLNSILETTDSDSISFEIEDAKDKLTEEQKEAVGDRPVYDINIKAGNENITSFNGKTITISLPYTLKPGEDPENIVVYYVKEDGSLEKVNCTYKDGKVIFETDHLSKYVIGYEESEPVTPDTPDDKKDDNNTIYYAVAAVIVILIIIALAYYFMKKKQ